MIDQAQNLLILNVVFVVIVGFFVHRMLRAASKFGWNPGDGDIQNKQKFIILKSILIIAFTALTAAIVNAFFG